MGRGWIILLGVALVCHGQAGKSGGTAAPAKAATEYRIAGIVVDASTGQPLPGARVSLSSAVRPGDSNHATLTSTDGRFAFEHLPADKYQLLAEAPGYPQQAISALSANSGCG